MASTKAILQSFFAELLISFMFGYAVFASSINTYLIGLGTSDVFVPLAVGFSAIAIIYTFVDHTICHFNPAITFAAILTRKIPFLLGMGYILSQIIGFIFAVLVVVGNFSLGFSKTLDIITPSKVDENLSNASLFFTEFVLTAILVFVAFANGINAKRNPEVSLYGDEPQADRSIVVPLVIGLTLGFLAFLGTSTSGGVFNPGLVFATQLIHNSWKNAWEYYAGQFTGGLFGALIQVWLLFK